MKRFISFMICLLMVCSLCACAKTELKAPLSYNEEFTANVPSSDITAAENDRYVLRWDAAKKRVIFYDKEKDIPWSYVPLTAQQERVDEEGFELTNNPRIESPIIVTYYDNEKAITDTAIATTASINKNTFSVEKNEKGLTMVLAFEKNQIEVTVDFILRDDSLAISVDPQKIREGESMVLSVAIAPFFCSVQNKTDDSYLFFPSGSGALIYADDSSEDVNIITEEVYGTDARRPEDDVIKNITSNVRIPVYGAKDGNRAVTAIIEENAGAAEINANVANSVIGYSGVYTTFNVRSREMVLTNNGSGQRIKYSDEMTINPMTIGFYPLYDDEADYVGMANCYKRYLKLDNLMQSNEDENAVTLKILGGATYKKSVLGITYSDLKATTTFEQAQKIISEIKNETQNGVAAQLYGFGISGTDIGKLAGNFKFAKALGDAKDIKNLTDYCNDNNCSLYMDFDLLQYSKSSSFAKMNGSSALEATGRRTTLYHYLKWSGTRDMSSRGWNNKSSYTLLKRSLIGSAIEKMQDTAQKYELNGLSVSTLSNIAYSDHTEQKYFSKGVIGEQISEELKKLREDNKVMVSDANAYAAANATRITDAPTTSSRYDVFDEDVPFYEIVFKGIIPISATPINLNSNSKVNLLKCIESGIGLSYVVSYNHDSNLVENENILFYASKYDGLKNSIVSSVNSTKEYYNAISGAEISEHTIMPSGVRKTVFDNGVTVYVNYTGKTVETPLGVLEAYDYIYE